MRQGNADVSVTDAVFMLLLAMTLIVAFFVTIILCIQINVMIEHYSINVFISIIVAYQLPPSIVNFSIFF